jgi:hypothetical protein
MVNWSFFDIEEDEPPKRKDTKVAERRGQAFFAFDHGSDIEKEKRRELSFAPFPGFSWPVFYTS